ncbi:MAG: sel1 repeat family protein [Candidatus Competibacteraceae bacterium]|nr:sel1 repeat family protein [Candidatus Competibacteraceae bacterium]
MNRYRSYVFVLICAALSACVDGEPEIPTALATLHKQAKAGNASAQLDLGIRYATGNGIMADEAAALNWIGLAANQGYAAAQYELGSYYTLESSRDDDEAARWLRCVQDTLGRRREVPPPRADEHLSRQPARAKILSSAEFLLPKSHSWVFKRFICTRS